MMHAPWTAVDLRPGYNGYQQPTESPNGYPPANGYRPATSRPAQPMEPSYRPPLHMALSDKAGRLNLNDGPQYKDYPAPRLENHARDRTLPGLRDILSSSRYSPEAAYNGAWSSNGHQAPNDTPARTYYSQPPAHPPMVYNPDLVHPPMVYNQDAIHPPMVLRPPESQTFQTQLPSRPAYAVSAAEDPRYGQPRPLSPLNAFPYRDVSRHGEAQSAPRPYLPNGRANVLHAPTRDGLALQTHNGALYRSSKTQPTVAGGEEHGKYLGVQEIMGEGAFHVYADGHRIPTEIDGEMVNPAWGLTKAKKPRKRLAMACLDCREKKIKCEPGSSGCIQCEKAMRSCRRAPEKHSQSEAPTNTLYVGGSPVRRDAGVPDSGPMSHRSPESDPMNKRSRDGPSPPFEPSKKQRDGSQEEMDISDDDYRRREDSAGYGTETSAPGTPRKAMLTLENDPYAVEPEITSHLLDVFFTRANKALCSVFPPRHFCEWVKNTPEKCPRERILLYAMLAAATVFAGQELTGFGKQCYQVASDAVNTQTGKVNVGLANAKVYLAFYQFAKGAADHGHDFVDSAVRIVTRMNLHTEDGCLDDSVSQSQPRYEFHLSPEQLAECKRRTFWACFICDRFHGAIMCALKPEDVFLRLPCTEEMYESGVASNAPFFENGIQESRAAQPLSACDVAPLAWEIQIAATWGEVNDFIFRTSHRSSTTYRVAYEAFYSSVQTRLEEWRTSLPDYLHYNLANLDRSITDGYVDNFIFMHALHHYTQVKLNRHMRHRLIPESVIRNIRAANHHAHKILHLVNAPLEAQPGIYTNFNHEQRVYALATPFVGYALLSAVDVISAGGPDDELGTVSDDIHRGIEYLRELERHWFSARKQQQQCQTRWYQIKNIQTRPRKSKGGCWLGRKWGIKEPLEQDIDPRDDCIYGLGERDGDEAEQRYYDAFSKK